jgi:hypothetical protein
MTDDKLQTVAPWNIRSTGGTGVERIMIDQIDRTSHVFFIFAGPTAAQMC